MCISFPDGTNNNYIVSVTLYVVCVNVKNYILFALEAELLYIEETWIWQILSLDFRTYVLYNGV